MCQSGELLGGLSDMRPSGLAKEQSDKNIKVLRWRRGNSEPEVI
jgi:hypothetical protein